MLPNRHAGIPIGNLTSQFFANVYLNPLDHYVKEVMQVPGYVRYVDDFVLFHDDPVVLAGWQEQITRFLAGRRLKLHPRKTGIVPTTEPAAFLGLVLLPGGYRRLPEDNVRRFRNRLRRLRDLYHSGRIDWTEVSRHIQPWIAHADHADSIRLREAIFRGAVFSPARRASSGVGTS